MKKLRLNLQHLDGVQVLTREQLKTIMGGNTGSGGSGGGCSGNGYSCNTFYVCQCGSGQIFCSDTGSPNATPILVVIENL